MQIEENREKWREEERDEEVVTLSHDNEQESNKEIIYQPQEQYVYLYQFLEMI